MPLTFYIEPTDIGYPADVKPPNGYEFVGVKLGSDIHRANGHRALSKVDSHHFVESPTSDQLYLACIATDQYLLVPLTRLLKTGNLSIKVEVDYLEDEDGLGETYGSEEFRTITLDQLR